jgi:hypothetical protein
MGIDKQKFANNASTTLIGTITDAGTSINVANGAVFPALGADEYFYATLIGYGDNGNENAWEIVKVTARSANLLTVARGQDGTIATAWPSATRVELRLNAGTMEAVVSTPPSAAALTNPGPIYVTQVKSITVTNYDGFSTYAASAARGTATISGDMITYTAPATDGGDTLTVTLNGVGRDIALDVLPAAVAAPTITSPAESAEISPSNVTITTSAFAPIGIADTHAKSQYVIKRGATTIYDSGESNDLTSTTIANPGLARGEAYTIEARHKGTTLGWSEWSAARSITTSNIGRGTRIDNKATVIGNTDGTPFTINGSQVWIAVLDAAYRGVSIKFGTYGYDSSLPNVTGSFGTMAQGEAESAMDARASAETGDSEGNCDVWMTRNAITDSQSIVGVPAVAMCRAISLDGTPCDLPTAKVLMRIWQHRDFIDTNDPTAAANTSKKLSAWGFGSADGAGVWSSSEYGSYYAVRVTSSGSVGYDSKSNQFGVVPVLEIPA